jgi:plastocyanin
MNRDRLEVFPTHSGRFRVSKKLWGVVVAATIALAACGGGGGGGGGEAATCSPSGTSLQITAQNNRFDENCLAAPAGQAFTITLDNDDAGSQHNVSIYTNDLATNELFKGDIITGPDSTTYNVKALDAGTYYFRCDVHPSSMNGTFIVK